MLFVAIKPGEYLGQEGFSIRHLSADTASVVYEGQVAVTFRRCGTHRVLVECGARRFELEATTVLNAALDWCHGKAAT
jgi:hypothetical protein